MRNDPFLSNYMIVRCSISENFKISFLYSLILRSLNGRYFIAQMVENL